MTVIFVVVVTVSPGPAVDDDACLRTARGVQGPGSKVRPSCSITVGRPLMYCANAGAAAALLFGTSPMGSINGDQLVGDGSARPMVLLAQLSPTVSTLT